VFQPFTTGPRRKQLHDVVHVVTGYDTSLIGELEVQAFLLGAHFRPTHVLISLGLLRFMRRTQAQIPDLWTRMQRAYDRGKQAQLNLDTWQPEDQWHLPLSQVQQELHIAAEPALVEFP
jgi:ubiquinone biosynthesis protein Coq4